MVLPDIDPFLAFVQAILRQHPEALPEAEWKRIRSLWLDGETDASSIVTRLRQGRLWER